MSEVLEVWIKTLKKPSTAHTYGQYLTRLFKEAHVTPEETIEKSKKDFETYVNLRSKALQTFTPHGSYQAISALRKFLFDNGVQILPPAKLEEPEQVKEIVQFEGGKEWKSGLAICAAAGKPYGLIFKLMLHCGWGAGEFMKFNTPEWWDFVKKNLQNGEKHEYIAIDFKGRKKNKTKFFSLVPTFLLQEILTSTTVPIRASHGYIFQDGRKIHQTKGIPLDVAHHDSARMYLEQAFKTAAKRAGQSIIVKGSPTLHTLRSIFRTQAHKVGCDGSAAEFAMGHAISPYNYNQCCSDKAWMWKNLSLIWEEATPQAVSAVHEENKALLEKMSKLEKDNKELSEHYDIQAKILDDTLALSRKALDVWGAIEKEPQKLVEIFTKAVDAGLIRLVTKDDSGTVHVNPIGMGMQFKKKDKKGDQ
ncbi:MAG: hypothetical protein ABSC50_00990 [Candidatus Bathyarchaeia archaeon]